MKTDRKTKRAEPATPPPPSRLRLGLLALLGSAVAAWSAFLWRELVDARRQGGEPFCGFGGGDCGELWDASFATGVHATTGVPVAGWGVVWGLAALVLPLLALRRDADGRFAAGARWVGVAGLAAVGLFLGASVGARLFCPSCLLAHGLAVAYGLVAWLGLPSPTPGARRRGLRAAATALALSFVAFLVPGLRTPKSADRAGTAALAAATAPRPAAPEPSASSSDSPTAAPALDSTSTLDAGERGRRIEEMIGGLEPEVRQVLSNLLAAWRKAPIRDLGPPRRLAGPAEAPVRIIEFTDSLCSHCATLHATLEGFRSQVPEGSFAVDSRQFPLDGNCNPHLPLRGPESVRCLAARARICVEETSHGAEYSGLLYGHQATLREGDVFSLAASFIGSRELSRCVGSAETAAKLRSDVDAAWLFEPQGTPFVVVNGREGSAYAPFLYALILAGGDLDLPAFGALPAPQPVS